MDLLTLLLLLIKIYNLPNFILLSIFFENGFIYYSFKCDSLDKPYKRELYEHEKE